MSRQDCYWSGLRTDVCLFYFFKEGGSNLYNPSTRFLPGIWVVGGVAVKSKSNAKINLHTSTI